MESTSLMPDYFEGSFDISVFDQVYPAYRKELQKTLAQPVHTLCTIEKLMPNPLPHWQIHTCTGEVGVIDASMA